MNGITCPFQASSYIIFGGSWDVVYRCLLADGAVKRAFDIAFLEQKCMIAHIIAPDDTVEVSYDLVSGFVGNLKCAMSMALAATHLPGGSCQKPSMVTYPERAFRRDLAVS